MRRHGGVITNVIGDGVLATFGVPTALSDHAERAVRCALDLHRGLDGQALGCGVRVNTRIGVNTGPVVAGSLGPSDRLVFSVLGAEVNMAARLEQLNKEYGTRILVGPGTYAATRHLFAYCPLPAVRVKGKAEPVDVYAVSVDGRGALPSDSTADRG